MSTTKEERDSLPPKSRPAERKAAIIELKNKKPSRYSQKLRTVPPDFFTRPLESRERFSTKVDFNSPAAPTGPYFFYGTLSDPAVITGLLDLDEEPKLRPAYICGYQRKQWGVYPALLDATKNVVGGFVYHVQSVSDAEKLAAYETDNYRAEACMIRYYDDDGQESSKEIGRVFLFAGDQNELHDGGGFELREWLKKRGRPEMADQLDALHSS